MNMRDADIVTFYIDEIPVELVSTETSHGKQTYADIDGEFVYLGSIEPTVNAAIIAYENFFNLALSAEDVQAILNS